MRIDRRSSCVTPRSTSIGPAYWLSDSLTVILVLVFSSRSNELAVSKKTFRLGVAVTALDSLDSATGFTAVTQK
jgi:hypothetical protein